MCVLYNRPTLIAGSLPPVISAVTFAIVLRISDSISAAHATPAGPSIAGPNPGTAAVPSSSTTTAPAAPGATHGMTGVLQSS